MGHLKKALWLVPAPLPPAQGVALAKTRRKARKVELWLVGWLRILTRAREPTTWLEVALAVQLSQGRILLPFWKPQQSLQPRRRSSPTTSQTCQSALHLSFHLSRALRKNQDTLWCWIWMKLWSIMSSMARTHSSWWDLVVSNSLSSWLNTMKSSFSQLLFKNMQIKWLTK